MTHPTYKNDTCIIIGGRQAEDRCRLLRMTIPELDFFSINACFAGRQWKTIIVTDEALYFAWHAKRADAMLEHLQTRLKPGGNLILTETMETA